MAIGVIDEAVFVIRSNPGPIFRRCEHSKAIPGYGCVIANQVPYCEHSEAISVLSFRINYLSYSI